MSTTHSGPKPDREEVLRITKLQEAPDNARELTVWHFCLWSENKWTCVFCDKTYASKPHVTKVKYHIAKDKSGAQSIMPCPGHIPDWITGKFQAEIAATSAAKAARKRSRDAAAATSSTNRRRNKKGKRSKTAGDDAERRYAAPAHEKPRDSESASSTQSDVALEETEISSPAVDQWRKLDQRRNRKESIVLRWLRKAAPHLDDIDARSYAGTLVDDGFDCIEMLDGELCEEDLAFMKKAHRRALARAIFLDGDGGDKRAQL